MLLRSGALPAKLTVIEERTVGASLGADSIAAGKKAALLGLMLVVLFMFAAYGLFGLFANIALLINIALIFGVLSLIGSTLTLPGIAGIVLTMGIAVDANVLINERIREEIRAGKSPIASVEAGYTRAMSTIVDSNVTTLISTLVLFWLGSGPVRGFAVTLTHRHPRLDVHRRDRDAADGGLLAALDPARHGADLGTATCSGASVSSRRIRESASSNCGRSAGSFRPC